ncbi:MAG: hypothetical protein QM723_24810 [Myxococcaceae bacterium]
MARFVVTLVALFALEGCNCGGGNNDGGTGGGGGDTHTITGHRKLFYRLADKEVSTLDPNLSSFFLQIPAGVGFTDRPILGIDDDGGFLSQQIDPGVEYFVALPGAFYIATSERDLDLDDHNNLGRPGLAPALNDTPVTLNIGAMTASATPDFRMVTANTGFYGEAQTVTQPTMPVTGINNEPGTFSFDLGALPDGTAGDVTFVAQRIARTYDAGIADAGLIAYHSTSGFAQLSALSLTDDGGLVSVTLSAPPESTLNVQVSLSDYLAHQADVNPMATVQGFELNVYPSPDAPGMPKLWVGYSGTVLDFFSTNVPAEPLSLVYADGYPADWQRMVGYDVVYSVPVALPMTTGVSSAFVGDTVPLSQLPATLKPRLSPVTALKVDGADAFAGGDVQSLNPTLSWSAPAVGTPSGYLVSVYKLVGAGNTTRRFQAGTIATTNTQVKIPPGIVSPQGMYVFRVTAELCPGIDLVKHPLAFATAVDLAVADVYSGYWNSP